MKLGINVGYWQRDPEGATETVLAAERQGYDSVWAAEAYGSDASTALAWYRARTSRIKPGTAVVQMSARTPAATAMRALTLDALSGGRLILGLGATGRGGLVLGPVPQAAGQDPRIPRHPPPDQGAPSAVA